MQYNLTKRQGRTSDRAVCPGENRLDFHLRTGVHLPTGSGVGVSAGSLCSGRSNDPGQLDAPSQNSVLCSSRATSC